jgi:TrmH family RNA methyltransferase
MSELPVISSHSNPLVKQLRALRQRKKRAASGLFLVEGIHHVGEAVQAGWDVDVLAYAPELLTSDFAIELVERARQDGIRCQPVTGQVLEALADKDNPQGILAAVHERTLTFADLEKQGFKRGVAAVSPQDPGNLGAILRTIDAIGVDGLFLLDGGVDLYHPSVIRASMGTIFWKPVVQASFGEFVDWAHGRGTHLIGTSVRGTVDYRKVELGDDPWVLVLGSEQKGLSAEQVESCDVTVSLPMRGRVSSLNLAVAAGILLYALGE